MMSSRGMFIAEGCKKRSQCQQWQESSLALTSFNVCYGTTGGGCHHEFVHEKKGGFEGLPWSCDASKVHAMHFAL